MEDALGVESSEQTHDLRVLLTMGERIRSHAAHLYFLALPDYLGKPNAVAIAADKPDAVKMAVALMKVGNDMVRVIGGRDMHPESATVGGFLHTPSQSDLDGLRARLQELRPGAWPPSISSTASPIQRSTASLNVSRCTTIRSTSL